MMRFLILFMFATSAAWAQPDAGIVADAAVAADASAVAASLPAGAPVIGDPDAVVAPAVVVDAAKDAVSAVQGAMARPTLLSIVFAVAAVLWGVLALIRAYGAKRLSARSIRMITLVAAPILTFLSAWGSGVPWFDAVILSGSGPGALLLNELGRGINPPAKA